MVGCCHNKFCFSHPNCFEFKIRYLGQGKYRSGWMYWMPFLWPWPKVMVVTLIITNLFVCMIEYEPLIQSLYSLAALSAWLWLLFDYIWRDGCPDWHEIKRKYIDLILGQLCDLDLGLNHDLDNGLYRSNFEITLPQIFWCEMERNQINWILSQLCEVHLWPYQCPWHWI